MLTPLETKLLESLRWAYELLDEIPQDVWPLGVDTVEAMSCNNAGMDDIRRTIAAAEAKERADV